MTRPAILITRKVFPDVVEHLRRHFDVDHNDTDGVLSPAQLIERLQGKVGALTTGSERIDGASWPTSRSVTTTSTYPR
jgi:glyoxylate/hydroxypyruvate/2-ketogluconate reductase